MSQAQKRPDIQQIVHALERQIILLDAQAAIFHAQRDYRAELLTEDADCLREAIVIVKGVLSNA